jgi:hypothetical protein
MAAGPPHTLTREQRNGQMAVIFARAQAGDKIAANALRYRDDQLAALKAVVANLNLSNLGSRVAYLECQAQVPSGHKHDGGFWISCPFCVDDPLGMCSACNGTRRIWEMPREDGA